MHLYLFTLEIDPLVVGEVYNPLPSHLTLVSRFWSKLSPDVIVNATRAIFEQTKPIELTFGDEDAIGPKKTAVHLIENSEVTKQLHLVLVDVLNNLNVTYTQPRFIGEGHLPHVSKRDNVEYAVGSRRVVDTVYLIEVEIRGNDHLRYVRAKFDLNG